MKIHPSKLAAAWLMWSLVLMIVTVIATQSLAQPEEIIRVEYIVMEPEEYKEYEETITPESVDPEKNLLGEYTITAYCGCEICCGEWASKRPLDVDGNQIVYGSYGIELTPDYSIASPLPEGTRVDIEELGIHEVQDTTSIWIRDAYEGRIIDLYMGNDEEAHQRALEWGKQTMKVWEVE